MEGDWVTRVEPSWMGLVTLEHSPERCLSIPPREDTGRRWHLRDGTDPHQTPICRHPHLGLSASRAVRNNCSLSPQSAMFCYTSWNELRREIEDYMETEQGGLHYFKERVSKWSQTWTISISWHFVRNADVGAPPRPAQLKTPGVGPIVCAVNSLSDFLLSLEPAWFRSHIGCQWLTSRWLCPPP